MTAAPTIPTAVLVLPAPVPASHARLGRTWDGRRVGYHDADGPYATWRRAAQLAVRAWWRGPPLPAHAPVALHIEAVSARPGRRPAWCPVAAWRTGGRLWRPVRPDLENFLEAVGDALQVPRRAPAALYGGGGWPLADDGCVVAIHAIDVMAAVGERPCTVVRVEVLDGIAWRAV